jgi:hypothetical protein
VCCAANLALVQPLSEVIIDEMDEELRTLVMERKFDAAVAAIETAHERIGRVEAADRKEGKLRREIRKATRNTAGHIDRIVDMLTFELRAPSLKKYERRRIIGWMIRLGHAEKALHIFLQNRSVAIKTDIRQISFQGDITVYISELSQVRFPAQPARPTDGFLLPCAGVVLVSSWCSSR